MYKFNSFNRRLVLVSFLGGLYLLPANTDVAYGSMPMADVTVISPGAGMSTRAGGNVLAPGPAAVRPARTMRLAQGMKMGVARGGSRGGFRFFKHGFSAFSTRRRSGDDLDIELLIEENRRLAEELAEERAAVREDEAAAEAKKAAGCKRYPMRQCKKGVCIIRPQFPCY